MILVGLMSGTSLDGISAAVVRFEERERRLTPELLAFHVTPYSEEQRARLTSALEQGTPDEYCRLNFDLGGWLAAAALDVMAEAGIARNDIAAIASHGQTIWHVPGHSTWQMGEAAVIAERTGIDVISGFRVRDMAAGGQGAPLVPIADRLLFSRPDGFRALQNLGGIGNVTIVPPNGEGVGVRAFDTGPGVVIMDGVVRHAVAGERYDVDGLLASEGSVVESALQWALAHPYYQYPPPKSTGRELFTAGYIEQFIQRCRDARRTANVADVVATAVALTAETIAQSFKRFVSEPVLEIVVSGGGAKNPSLVAAIARAVAPIPVVRFQDIFFDGEAKEAVAFALMGYLHLTGRPGNVPSATGARGARVLGHRTPGA